MFRINLFFKDVISIVGEFSSISTNTGFRFAFITAKAVEQYVIAGIITSDPFLRFNEFKAIVNASVPLATPIAYIELQNFENFFQIQILFFQK